MKDEQKITLDFYEVSYWTIYTQSVEERTCTSIRGRHSDMV